MSLPVSLTPSAVLPTTNIHPHGHHRGSGTAATSAIGSTSASSSSGSAQATDAPDGSTEGLFSTILNSLEGVIGASTGISLGSIGNNSKV